MPHPPTPETRWAWRKGHQFRQQGKPLHTMPVSVRQSPELKKWFLDGYNTDPAAARPSAPQRLSAPARRALWLGLAILAGFATAENMLQDMHASLFQRASSDSPLASIKSSPSRSITPSESDAIGLLAPSSEAALDLLDEEALAKRHDRKVETNR